ncbi:MAG: hypothetical protein N4A41_01260 [Crocinitomicaceae bacterium]|jgi:hypothetical protein|nr:hypothetical protein [Crocinitomicaceae bacterium]
MISRLLIFIFFLVGTIQSFAQLSVQGTYQGKNLYIQNPIDEDGFGFCATKVTVNGDIMPGGTSQPAFEIDFAMFNIAIGEPVFIVIEHNDGCRPKILNPEVLLPRSTYEVKNIKISETGRLTWTTSGEKGKLPFVIEQYRWNKWVAVGEVQGKGTESENTYEFQVTPHSGENRIRVAQFDHTGKGRYSTEVKFDSALPPVSKSPAMVKDRIEFKANNQPVETRYEIYDAYGNIVKKGVGSVVNCANLVKGVYYINYDNVNEKFIKQ